MRLFTPWALLWAACSLAAPRVVVSTDLPGPMKAAWEGAPAELRWSPRPLAADLADAQVLVLHRERAEKLPAESLAAIRAFVEQGGGIVLLGFGVAAGDGAWGKAVAGGGWTSSSRAHAEKLLLVLRTDEHPLTRNAASLDLDDATLFDLDLDPDIRVLGAGFTPRLKGDALSDKLTVFDSQPQLWIRETKERRAAVLLQANAASLAHPTVRALMRRAAAWTAGLNDLDRFCRAADLAELRYPAGGPSRPERTVESLRLPAGFTARLVAAEPLIRKPIAVQWDAAGRLWVAETPEYPNGRRPLNTEPWKDGGSLVPGVTDRPAQDSIAVLGDTDGDGVADRRDVFHQGLELITGFCLHRDGVIAVAQGRITWLRDTDGDGKADREQDLFHGFTPGDTHFVTNGFTHAPDGWVYASTGSGTTVTHPVTKREMARLSPGTFRFRPDGSAIEQIASAGGNAFGAEVTSDLEVFHNKATTGSPIQHVVLPEAVLARSGGSAARAFHAVNPGRRVAGVSLPSRAPYMQIDQVGRFSSSCSTLVLEDPLWPADYQRNVFLTEPILDVVTRELLVPDGPTYRGDPGPHEGKWLRSADSWFLPIALELAPSGEMMVLDFYSPVVAHNDTRGPLHSRSHAAVRPDREHLHGRIYAILPPGAKPRPAPDLTRSTPGQLVAAYSHPSRQVRATAQRLLHERAASADAPLAAALRDQLGGRDEVAILALWSLARLGAATDADLARLAAAASPGVRRNVFLVAESLRRPLPDGLVRAGLSDPDARVQLAALRALGAAPMSPAAAADLLALQSAGRLNPWAAAAAAAAANSQPGPLLLGLLASGKSGEPELAFARSLANGLSLEDNDSLAAVLKALAAPAVSPAMARALLSTLAARGAPRADLDAPLAALLEQPDLARAAAAAPLVRRWASNPDGLLRTLAGRLAAADLPDPAALAAVRGVDPSADRRLGQALAGPGAGAAVDGLLASGRSSDTDYLLARLGILPAADRVRALDGLLDRPAVIPRLLDLIAAGKLSVLQLSPFQKSRLTGHPDPALARRANEVLAALNAGGGSSKGDLIAQLLPQMRGPSDPAKGRAVFQQACAICHRLGDEGMDVGPNLTGIGLHPPGDLLLHILDPNRMVDDERRAWALTLRDGSQVIGLIASENTAGITLRLPGGVDRLIPAADIAKREPRAQSLMPEGYESLGAEGLRNLLAYLRVAAGPAAAGTQVGRFFLVDLAGAVTADSRRGIYLAKEAVDQTLRFRQFGDLAANGVPFRVLDPARHPRQANLIVLRGGPDAAFSRGFPREVSLPVGVAAHRLHLLGAVAGWGSVGDGRTPALSLEIRHVDGTVQTAEFNARRDFVDYINPALEAPGSRQAKGLLHANQVRTLAVDIRSRSPIAALVLRSPDNIVVPTTAALTLETEPPLGPAPTAGTPPAPLPAFAVRKSGLLRVLLAGAGSSHDFPRHFLGTDAETLRAAGGMEVVASGDADHAAQLLAEADVLVLSANAPEFGRDRFQSALNAFADAGKGIVPLHAAVWHNWPGSTGYNARFVGGGARGHGAGIVTTRLKTAAHPVLAGLPPTFAFWDESYHVELDPAAPVTVLATNDPDTKTRKPHPSVWIVAHPKARIVCLSHGHDERAHGHPAYRRLLTNAVNWAGGR
jgi:hypothetical protein